MHFKNKSRHQDYGAKMRKMGTEPFYLDAQDKTGANAFLHLPKKEKGCLIAALDLFSFHIRQNQFYW